MDRQMIYQNDFFNVYIDQKNILSMQNRKGGSAVLPVTSDGKLILLKIHRAVFGKHLLEIPRGFHEMGETLLQTATRELKEEISGTSDQYISLGTIHPDSGIIDEELTVYLAKNVTWDDQKLQSEEGIKSICLLDFADAYRMAENSEITDSFTIAALLRSRKYFI